MSFTKIPGGVTAPQGFKAAGLACGIKESGKKDLALIFSQVPAKAAAVFTSNKIKAAPLEVSRRHLSNGVAQAIIINSGNANACTGRQGFDDALQMAQSVAEPLKISPQDVLVASTGVIGNFLPMVKIKEGVKRAIQSLTDQGSSNAAEAIMTTDTFPKEIAFEFEIEGRRVRIGGIAKGSGMIAPNMATMLAFLTTDVKIDEPFLKDCLKRAVDSSFNTITVDGQMSTNDMVAILANGMVGNKELGLFEEALHLVCQELAKMIVKDGEGATKFVEIVIEGAMSQDQAKGIALAIANSNLVKTAFYGEDANWGRIMAALGSSGGEIDPDKIEIFFGTERIVVQGVGIPYDQDKVSQILKSPEIQVTVNLNLGQAQARVWTTDLSPEYVKINAAYRT